MDVRSGIGTEVSHDESIWTAIDRFCAELVGARQRSSRTEKAYRCDLQQFAAVVGAEMSVAAIERRHIEQWLAQLCGQAYKPSSLRRKMACLRSFLWRQRKRGILDNDPFAMIEVAFDRERRLTRILGDREFELLLAEADRRAEGSSGDPREVRLLVQRDQAIVWLLCGTGLRVGELVQLTTKDTDPEAGVMRVNGKGSRQRLAFVVDGDRERLASYLRTRAWLRFKHDHVFVNHRGRAITTEGVRSIVAKLARASGLDQRVTPHMLRHTAATRLLHHGANLRVVQEFLGHSSIRTTERYTHVTATALREAVMHHSPLKRRHTHGGT